MAVAAAEPRRKSRRANVVLNFDRKTAADFSGGWSIRLELLPNRLSANKFPCQTSYERRSQRFLSGKVGPVLAEMERSALMSTRAKESVKLGKQKRKEKYSYQYPLIISIVIQHVIKIQS